ncbi:histone-like nucleoid-structuring protein Lsr2 [Streptomyces sp. NPDC058274]|uniref:Lsr2 family DNA-binding protein n=1 Tax=Streptomyces sp. NPDC058274 TaxID=3346416 RepID=UPI0036E6B444
MLEVDEEIDLEDMAAWVLRQTWLGMTEDSEFWQRREFFPQLIEMYRKERPKELERERREAERRAQQAEMDRRRRASAQAAAHQAWLMKDMRKWGPENGYFVGTRGRIPRKVIEAYKEAKGL